jgi:hypothetical protein
MQNRTIVPKENTGDTIISKIHDIKNTKKEILYTITLEKNGTKFDKQFPFVDKVGLHPLQKEPKVFKAMNYSIIDLYNISEGVQPNWSGESLVDTKYGEILPPSRGIEIRPDGSRGLTDMILPQVFGDRKNHQFKTFLHAVTGICLKSSCINFYLEPTTKKIDETHWFRRDIWFDKPILHEGTRKQDYPMITYFDEIEGETYRSTGYSMAIEFKRLFGNGIRGKYSIDKFIIGAVAAIAWGFADFFHMLFFLYVLDMDSEFYKHIKRIKKKYKTLDDYLRFDEEIWGILNTEHIINPSKGHFPVEKLLNKLKGRIRMYNDGFGKESTPGITIPEEIVIDERYKTYNRINSFVGSKDGTFRNKDEEDEGDDIWKTKKMGGALIFGAGKFKDEKNPEGNSPLQQILKLGYFSKVPSYKDVIDEQHIEDYESRHHNISAICTKVLPVVYNPITYESIINLVNPKLLDRMFHEETTLKAMISKIYKDKEKEEEHYLDIIYKIIVHTQWKKKSKENIDEVIQNIRYSLTEEPKVVISQPQDGNKKHLSQVKGVKELMILIKKLINFFKEIGVENVALSLEVNELILKIFLHLILEADEIKAIVEDTSPTLANSRTTYSIVDTIYNQLVDIINKKAGLSDFKNIQIRNEADFKQYFAKDIYSFKKLFLDKLLSIKQEQINIDMLQKFRKWNIPMFFQMVLMRFEIIPTFTGIVGTENMGQRKEVDATVASTFDEGKMEAYVTFKNNCAITILRKRDAYVAKNIKLKLDYNVNRLHCDLPKKSNEFFKVMLFYCKTELDSLEKLFFRGVDEDLEQFLEPSGYKDYIEKHAIQEINLHLEMEDFIEDDFEMVYDESEYHMKRKPIRNCAYAYRDGIKMFNPTTKKWDSNKRVTGPMHKFYWNKE